MLTGILQVLGHRTGGRAAVPVKAGGEAEHARLVFLNAVIRTAAVPFGILRQLFVPLGHHRRVACRLCLFLLYRRRELCSAVGAEFCAHRILLAAGGANRALGYRLFGELRPALGAEFLISRSALTAGGADFDVLCRFGGVALHRALQVCHSALQAACLPHRLLCLLCGGLRCLVDGACRLVRKLGGLRLNRLLYRIANRLAHGVADAPADGSF